MRMIKIQPNTFINWVLIIILLSIMAIVVTFSEDSIDQAMKPFCPDGLWHAGLNWAHCAYPPISIAKYTSMYLGFSISALLVVYFLAPQSKFNVSLCLLLILIAAPSYSLLFDRFSWIASFSLIGTAALTLVFVIYTKVMKI